MAGLGARKLRVLTLTMAVAALLSACGGQSLSSDGATATAEPPTTTADSPPSATTSPSSGGMVIETITMPPDMPAAEAGQLIEGEIRYLQELRANGVAVPDSKAALRDAEMVCDMIGLKGFRATTEAVTRI